MSTNWPPVSNIPSISRRFRPLSMTCVSPSPRGLPGRWGRSRKPSLKPGIQLLQLLLRARLHVVVERVAVRVDADGERAEVLDAELPEALGHQLLPRDLLDLLDLRGLERRRADDREVDHAVLSHRLDRLVGEAALAADRSHAVLRTERLGEAHHARARRRADADLLVAALTDLAHAGRGVKQEGAAEVHRRLDALVEDPDLRAVADADDVSLDDHLVAGAQLQDFLLVRDRERHLVRGHYGHLLVSDTNARTATSSCRDMQLRCKLSPAYGHVRVSDSKGRGVTGSCRNSGIVTPPGRSRWFRRRRCARSRGARPSTGSSRRRG